MMSVKGIMRALRHQNGVSSSISRLSAQQSTKNQVARSFSLHNAICHNTPVRSCSISKSSILNTNYDGRPQARIFSTTTPDSDTSGTKGKETTANSKGSTTEGGGGTPLEFKAETRQLLDIVTNSLYTDKEVFLRELVSNASDALEKLRHTQVANPSAPADSDVPLEIHVDTDEVNGTLSIRDTGIGLTKSDMVANLGTIASSGSKAFINEMSSQHGDQAGLDATRGIIGRFGVGFYSAFMVGDKVEVRSK